jgi:Holliday junction resolvasome RuvABC DNA-binding subunit
MNNINETLNKNIEAAVKIIEQQKKEIKMKKDEKVRAETRIEENQKGLLKDYEEVRAMGFDPENIENAIKELDESLEEYNQKILEYIKILNA